MLVIELRAESKEKHGVLDPIMPELTITSPNVHSRVDSDTFTIGKPMLESTLSPPPHALLLARLSNTPNRMNPLVYYPCGEYIKAI
jgi:hypothetical protein